MAFNADLPEAQLLYEEQVCISYLTRCKQPQRTMNIANGQCNQDTSDNNMANVGLGGENAISSSLPNPRKRPLHDDPTSTSDLGQSVSVEDEPSQSSKRTRRAASTVQNEVAEEPRKSTRQRKSKATSPHPLRRSNRTPRPSKFAEGSMNDKPSKRPPSFYTREEEAMEEYLTAPSDSQPETSRSSQDAAASYNAGIEQGKPSTMYRFGKAIASVFNPVSAWTGRWKSKEPQVDQQKIVLQERQAKAEKAYAELKKTGFKGTQGTAITQNLEEVPMSQFEGPPSSSQTASFRDSAIDVEESQISVDNKDDTRMIDSDRTVMPAPFVPLVRRSVSPMPSGNGRRSSLNLPTPSLSSLKRVGSHLQLPSSKRHSAQDSSRSSTEIINPGPDGQQLRTQPSHKDLLKQQRLYNKVSNLEAKLEAARRELEAAQGFTPDGNSVPSNRRSKSFTPGALPSLPSERILKNHIHEGGVPEIRSHVLKVKNTDHGTFATERWPNPKKIPILFPNLPPAPKEEPIHKIESKKGQTASSNGDSAASQSRSKTTPTRQPMDSSTGNNKLTSQAVTRSQPEQQTSGKTASRKRHTATAPPVPELPPPFNPLQVDKAKIMLMRDAVDYRLPFGQSAMDPVNLRRTYPLITEAQIQNLIGAPPSAKKGKKNTDVTSTTHLNHVDPPTLSPPRSPSPANGEFKPSISKKSLRSGSQKVPNNSPASVRKTTQAEFEEITRQATAQETSPGEEKDVVGPLNEAVVKGLPPYPKDTSETAETPTKAGKRKPENEKPLPGVQREDFDWDKDVF